MTDSRIPVTILTGFLGAGKTTLLNQLLRQHANKKIAVIENEFGEISIDSDLIVKTDGAVFELKNGCVCCSLNGELVDTLNQLLEREETMDHLLIETTGIADPGPVALSFLTEMDVQETFRLDAVVALVDVQFIERQLETQPEAGKQIALADVVLLNKTDQAEPYTIDTARNIIKRINPQAQIASCKHGLAEGLDLLAVRAFDPETVLKQNWKPMRALTLSPNYQQPNHGALVSHSFELSEPLDLFKFNTWVSGLLYFNAAQVFRIKGILDVEDSEDKIIFQSVCTNFVSQSGGKWAEGEKRLSRLVFIGRHLERSTLEKALQQCRATLLT